MSELTIEVSRREHQGKNKNRQLRAQGMVPAVVYGGQRDSVPIQVERRKIEEMLRNSESDNPVFLLKLGEKSRHAMIREMQTNSVTGQMLHLDFQRVLMDQVVRVTVPIELQGVAYGVKNESGIVDFVTREIEVECLPGNIPNSIEIDITALHVGQHLEVHQLDLPDGVEVQEEPQRVLVSIAAPRLEVEVEEEEDDGLLGGEAKEPEVLKQKGDVE